MGDATTHRRRSEAATAAGVFFVAFAVGSLYSAFQDRPPQFFQEWFAPSVLLASGHGYSNVDTGAIPALHAFLDAGQPDVNVFDPVDLPAALSVAPLNAFQSRHRYLLTAVAVCFAFLGIAWSSLWPLYGLLYGTTCVAAYGLFRTLMGRGFALLCTFMLVTSPLHLLKLPGLRDYSKAPFILLIMLVLAVLLTRPLKWHGNVALGVAAGLAMGVGVGFRIDVLIVAFPLLSVWLIFAAGPWRETLLMRLAGIGVFVLTLFVVGGPILLTLAEGGNKSHPALLGLADRFDGRLELAMPAYDLQHTFYDAEVMLKLQAFEKHRTGEAPLLDYETPAYERIADDYYGTVLRTFPADFTVRGLSAVVGTIEGLRPGSTYPTPPGIDFPGMEWLYGLRQGIEKVLLIRPLYMLGLLLLGLAAVALRPALAWFVLAIFFTGYTAIQYSTRHSFHLEFLPILIGGAFYQRCLWSLQWLWRKGIAAAGVTILEWLRHNGRSAAIRMVLFVALASGRLLGPLWELRLYQEWCVTPVLEAYAAAPRSPAEYSLQPREDGGVLMVPAEFPPNPEVLDSPAFSMRYFVLTFDTTHEPVHGQVVYSGAVPDNDLSHDFHLPATSPGMTAYSVPVFRARLNTENDEWVRFEGFAFDADSAGRLVSMEAYDDPFGFPFYMSVMLTPDWKDAAHYQVEKAD